MTGRWGCTAFRRRWGWMPPSGWRGCCTWPRLGCWRGLPGSFHFGAAGWAGVTAVAALLLYEHLLVSPRDLRRLNAAFFTMNGVIAMVFLMFVAVDVWIKQL